MKTKLKSHTSPGHCANLVLAAGANESNSNEAHGLAGFWKWVGCAACKLVWRFDSSKTFLLSVPKILKLKYLQ